jgi:streptogramin lyase
MATQVFNSNDPNHGYIVLDASPANNGAAINAPSNAGAQGYDDANYPPVVGGASQATNPYSNGTVLVDTTHDYMALDPQRGTVTGNPVQNNPTVAVLSTVVINTAQQNRVVWKNPA